MVHKNTRADAGLSSYSMSCYFMQSYRPLRKTNVFNIVTKSRQIILSQNVRICYLNLNQPDLNLNVLCGNNSDFNIVTIIFTENVQNQYRVQLVLYALRLIIVPLLGKSIPNFPDFISSSSLIKLNLISELPQLEQGIKGGPVGLPCVNLYLYLFLFILTLPVYQVSMQVIRENFLTSDFKAFTLPTVFPFCAQLPC